MLKEVIYELMQKFLSALHTTSGRNLDQLSATILTGALGPSVKLHLRLASWLMRARNKLHTDGGTFI